MRMKSQGKFCTVSIALVASAAIILSGCGVSTAASSQQSGKHVAQAGKTAVRTTVKTKQTVSKTPNWANMTAEQLGQYDKIHGGAPPFGGTDVVRVAPAHAVAAIPEYFLIEPGHAEFEESDFRITDAWEGKLRGKPFLLDVYTNKKTKNVIVGVRYAGRPIIAYSLRTSRYILRNFVGSYVGFAVPSMNWRLYYAINLATGQVIAANPAHPANHLLIMELAGCYPCVGAFGAGWITGLPKQFPFSP